MREDTLNGSWRRGLSLCTLYPDLGLVGSVTESSGGFILAAAPFALWPLACVVCILTAFGALALEGYIPERLRRIPRDEASILGLAEPAPV